MVSAQILVKAQFNFIKTAELTLIETFVVGLRNPLLWLAFALLGFAAVLWYLCISRLPLSVAFFFAALAYPMILLGSFVFLGESFGLKQVIGCGFIVLGVLMVAVPQAA
ncbi:MAG: EamA family transporter [Rhodothermales bacterium]